MSDVATITTPDVRGRYPEVVAAREHLQATLEAIVAQTRADMSEQWQQWNESGGFMQWLLVSGNTFQGVAYGIGQYLAGLWDMVQGLGQLLTAPFDTVDHMLAELDNLSSEAKELFILIYHDEPTRDMLIQFAGDWWAAIPPDEQAQLQGQYGGQILLDFAAAALLSVVSGGAGGVAVVAKWSNRIRKMGGRAAGILDQLDNAFEQLGRALRKRDRGYGEALQADDDGVIETIWEPHHDEGWDPGDDAEQDTEKFTPLGIQGDPADSETGRTMMNELWKEDPNASLETISERAEQNMQSNK